MPRNLKNRGFLGSWAVGSDTFCSIFREQSKAGTRVRLGAIVRLQSRLEPIVSLAVQRCGSDAIRTMYCSTVLGPQGRRPWMADGFFRRLWQTDISAMNAK